MSALTNLERVSGFHPSNDGDVPSSACSSTSGYPQGGRSSLLLESLFEAGSNT